MKRFQFKLEAVLSLRKHKENLVMQEVGVLNAERLRAEEGLDALAREVRSVEDDLARRMDDGLTGAQLLAVESYLETLARKQVELASHLDLVNNHLDVKKQELFGCSLERKSMESLRERQETEFAQEMAEAQRKDDDEIALVHRAAVNAGR